MGWLGLHSRGRSSRRRRWGRLSHQLAAALALWLAVSPFAQLAHLVLADHDHRFCAEHGRIEDVSRAQVISVLFQTADELTVESGEARTSPPFAHRVCGVLNQGAARVAWSLGAESVILAAEGAVPVPGGVSRRARGDLPLVTAPKTSPPRFLV